MVANLPKAVTIVLNSHDLQRDDVAFIDDFLGMTDPTVDQLGDMYEPLDGTR